VSTGTEAPERSVLVLGAGIAGIQASLDLAQAGIRVHLVEGTPTIGGRMPQLDKTFPTNDCSMCILSPKMSECVRHPLITLHILSSLEELSGEPGDFRCRVRERARYVDPAKCVSCGLCEEKCPVKLDDVFDAGLRKTKAISRYFLQSIPAGYTIRADACLRLTRGVCGLCEKVCPAGAVDFQDRDVEIELRAGAVILATGIEPFDPIGLGRYRYRGNPNVVTALEFERMLSASGPLGGHVVRASDHAEPRRIAFIQCVGSRDEGLGRNYCSSACCMFAIKQAIIAREHMRNLEVTVFYMDIRAFGKDFDRYYEKAEAQYGVRFTRARVAEAVDLPDGGLDLVYTLENGTLRREAFDMVVLSTGLQPRAGTGVVAEALDVRRNGYGFLRSDTFHPLETSREGVFVCGAANGPRDIPESVVSASGAVVRAMRFLEKGRGGALPAEPTLPETDVTGERPRIGVFVCHCGVNIAGVVDVRAVAAATRGLRNVEHSEDVVYACSTDCLETIRKRIAEHDLNRVVVAACTPRTHEPLFRETIREAGLNPYLFEMANIRDQCSWPHMDEPALATEKSRELVEMAVAKARGLAPLERLPIRISPEALVLGGGLAGMTAALDLADAGHDVHLVEKEDVLGGNMRDVFFTFDGADPQEFLGRAIERVRSHPRIRLLTGVRGVEISGFVGNFSTTVEKSDGARETISHGAVIVATGGVEHRTGEYLYGSSTRVVTQTQFERMLREGTFPPGRLRQVVMIQCVGSREPGRMRCSRICCSKAVKNALELRRRKANVGVALMVRDVRTYGFAEEHYTRLRDQGALVFRYVPEAKPLVEAVRPGDPDSPLRVTLADPVLEREVVVDADLLVLATAIDPPEGNPALARMLKVPLNADGLFLEAHVKLRPVDFATEGIFVCGLAHGPKDMNESIAQAGAAAGRALTFLRQESILAEGTIAEVRKDRCTGCGYCQAVCAYTAVEVDPAEGVAVVNEALCKGCGACVAICRCGAMDLRGFSNRQIYAVLEALDLESREEAAVP